jgi:Domain of unknown function (DUF4329)
MDPQSIATNTELVGIVYRLPNGKYSWMFPLEGSEDQVAPVNTSDIPHGTLWAGQYHTHGAYDPTAYNEQFSPMGCHGPGSLCDIGIALSLYLNNGHTGLFRVATPAGRFEIYDPSKWGTPNSLCVAVGSAVPAGVGSSTFAINTCN